MKLVENWEQILNEAWTVKVAYAATVVGAIGQALTYIPESILTSVSLNASQMSYVGGILAALGLLLTAIIPRVRIEDQGLAKAEKDES